MAKREMVLKKDELVAAFCRQERAFTEFDNKEAATIARNWAAIFLFGPLIYTTIDIDELVNTYTEKYGNEAGERKWHHAAMAAAILIIEVGKYL